MDTMVTFGYLCPHCGQMVMGSRSIFALEASNATVSCDCEKSSLQVQYDGEQYHIYVPCGLCGETHVAKCSPTRVHHTDMGLGCAKTKQFSCFIGEEGTVEKNLRELAILADKEHQQQQAENPENFSDSALMYEVLSELKDIASRPHGITCQCGAEDYGIAVRRSTVDITCHSCGSKLRIGAATDDDLDNLCCKMTLVIPSGL
ncbi:hypothetical protein RFF05_04665 [Bengtsoniella intestinalis]|uniref:hypothetical protein n=1 Tax=Bengtsoniella intestinalis TaxID=3073143 RepID=UPI00391F805C